MDAAVVSDVFQNAVDQADDAALASDVFRRARITGGILLGYDHRVADFEFAVRGLHRITQSGRTRGISRLAPNFIAISCSSTGAGPVITTEVIIPPTSFLLISLLSLLALDG